MHARAHTRRPQNIQTFSSPNQSVRICMRVLIFIFDLLINILKRRALILKAFSLLLLMLKHLYYAFFLSSFFRAWCVRSSPKSPLVVPTLNRILDTRALLLWCLLSRKLIYMLFSLSSVHSSLSPAHVHSLYFDCVAIYRHV